MTEKFSGSMFRSLRNVGNSSSIPSSSSEAAQCLHFKRWKLKIKSDTNFVLFGGKHTNLLWAVFEMTLFLPSKWEVAVVVVESHRDGFLHDMVSDDVSVEVLGDPLRRGWHSRPPLCPWQLHDFIRLYQSSLSYVPDEIFLSPLFQCLFTS